MVGDIYFIEMPYSNFRQFKGRPVLLFKVIDNNDMLILPLTTNLQRDGVIINNNDIEKGSLKKESVVIVPKITAIDISLIVETHYIATLKTDSFKKVHKSICYKIDC